MSLPTPLEGACGAAVNNVLYVMGGAVDGVLYNYSSAVRAFDLYTNTWSVKAAMPTAFCRQLRQRYSPLS